MATLLPSKEPNSTQQKQIERKYGMFIHFGINTFNDLEWSDGTLPATSYAPKTLDVDSWIKNARDCGMKYVIIITKHHDGFCMFHSKYTDYSVEYSANKADVISLVSKACQKYGIKLGMYYSLWDRHEKSYSHPKKYIEYMCNQLRELLCGKYGEVCELWLDGSWERLPKRWNIQKLYTLAHELQPDCSVSTNLTIGSPYLSKSFQKPISPEKYREGMPIRFFPSDFRLKDPDFPPLGKDGDPKLYRHKKDLYYLPFEATICMRTSGKWFGGKDYLNSEPRKAEFIAEKYMHMVEQNNNLVVNVAPNIFGKQEETDILPLIEARKILESKGYAF